MALKALTGYTASWTKISSAVGSTMRDQVYSSKTLGMVATSKSSGTKNGVVANHSYMIYNVYTRNGVRYVRLYNPWKTDSSSGALDSKNDGLITLSWSQFKANVTGYYRVRS